MSQMDTEHTKLILSLKLLLTEEHRLQQAITHQIVASYAIYANSIFGYFSQNANWYLDFVSLSEQPGLPATQHTSSKDSLMPEHLEIQQSRDTQLD